MIFRRISTLLTIVLTFKAALSVNITFSVDMKNEVVSSDGVHLAGSFQSQAGYPDNWNPATTKMLDADGDDIYTITLDIPQGYWEFKYVNGNNWDGAEDALGDCTVGQYNNRVLNVGNESLMLKTVVFGECPEALESNYTYPDTSQPLFWWNNRVFYEIFVRSFADSDGDGIGDFQGIIDKINYLNDNNPKTNSDLGIGGIWLMPMMKSTSYHGYDIEDYYEVEDDYGSMTDFQRLLDTCHAHDIKVIIDLVINHSSVNHPWFKKSAANDPTYRSWYRWDENPPTDLGPWGQQVWHARNNSNYYGIFWGGMPDLNYDEPAVFDEIKKITTYWLEKGVDGFRLDAIKYLDEDGTTLENTPKTFELLNQLRQHVNEVKKDAFMVGEVWDATPKVLPYVSDTTLNSCFDFTLADHIRGAIFNKSASQLNVHLQYIQDNYPLSQYSTFLTNHDQNRIYSELNRTDWMKLASSIYLTLPGVPFVYYGEEIALTGVGDHLNIRTPMQWNGSNYAGFSNRSPWRSFAQDFKGNNVELQQESDSSIWSHYQRIIDLRNNETSLQEGIYWPIKTNHSSLFTYARTHGKMNQYRYVLTLHNLGDTAINLVGRTSQTLLKPGTRYLQNALTGDDLGEIMVNDSGEITQWPDNFSLSAFSSLFLRVWDAKTTKIHTENNVDVKIYPNPTEGKVRIKSNGSNLQYVSIYSVNGQQILERKLSNTTEGIDLSGFQKGLYIMIIEDNQSNRWIEKVMIAR